MLAHGRSAVIVTCDHDAVRPPADRLCKCCVIVLPAVLGMCKKATTPQGTFDGGGRPHEEHAILSGEASCPPAGYHTIPRRYRYLVSWYRYHVLQQYLYEYIPDTWLVLSIYQYIPGIFYNNYKYYELQV